LIKSNIVVNLKLPYKIRALRELGYDEIDKSNASEVLDKIAEIMAQKF
jgi:hypothetical protein